MTVDHLTKNNPFGTGLGQSPTDLIGFYGAPPVVRQPSTVDGTTQLVTLGLVPPGTTFGSGTVSTMSPAKTGPQNAAALVADAAAAAGKLVTVPPGTYTVGAAVFPTGTRNIYFTPGAVLVPDSSLYRSGRMLQFNGGVTRLWNLDVDGRTNGAPIMCRQDAGRFYAYNTKMINVGVASGPASTVGVYGIVTKTCSEVVIDGWYGTNFGDQPNGVFADQPGLVRHIFVYECDAFSLLNGFSEGGFDGEDQDYLHFLDLRTPTRQYGTISNWKFRYNARMRRCVKIQGGQNLLDNIDCRPGDDFVSVTPGVTDVGVNTLNCVDYAGAVDGFMRVSNSYIDGTGYDVAVGCSLSGGKNYTVFDNCTVKASRLNSVRNFPDTGAPQNQSTIGFYVQGGDQKSGLYNCEVIGAGRGAVMQGHHNELVNCTFDDPRDIGFEHGSSTQKIGGRLLFNKVITRTPGSLTLSSSCCNVRNNLNMEIVGNQLVQDGNTTHASTFITTSNAGATGFAALNYAPSGTTPFNASTSAIDVKMSNNVTTQTFTINIPQIETVANKTYTITYSLDFAGTVTNTKLKSASGTCTGTFQLNGGVLGGGAHSVTSAETSIARSSSNTFTAGAKLDLVVTSNSSCLDLIGSITITRNM